MGVRDRETGRRGGFRGRELLGFGRWGRERRGEDG